MKSVFYNLSNPAFDKRKGKVIDKSKKSLLKFLIAVFVIPSLILLVAIGSFIIYFTIFTVESPYKSVNEGSIVEAVNDAIKMYGTDFTKVLAAYLIENKSFDNYDRIKMWNYQDEEYLEKILEDSTAMEFKESFDNLYGSLLNEDSNGKSYYNWYFPIALNEKGGDNYQINYEDDYGNARTYGGERTHKGIDLMCKEGTPIIAVEGGTVQTIGWNELGGWRIGIVSEDGERFWYYAHMKRDKPYAKGLKKGLKIEAGQVIGYVGSTGYSDNLPDNTMPQDSNGRAVNGNFASHLHLGYINYEEGNNYYNPYPILRFIEDNRVTVKESSDNEFAAIEKNIKSRYIYISSVFSSGKIGQLSEKYESNGNPGAIGNNYGDFGGKSYGAFQFSSNIGSLATFLRWLKTADSEIYSRLYSAYENDGKRYSTNFDIEWVAVSNEDTEKFYNLQYTYIKSNYFDPVVLNFRNSGIIDFTKRSEALQNVVWSTSVQNGSDGAIGIIGTADLSADDAMIIKSIYNERKKVNVYFPSSSPAIRNSVYNRLIREESDALTMLENEKMKENDDKKQEEDS